VYRGVAPGSESWKQREVAYRDERGEAMVRNVVRPTLTAYLPAKDRASGAAMIVAPGGGFRWLSWQSEGTQVAEWLQAHGVAAFVLKYRLANTGATEEDLRQASARLGAMADSARGDSVPANAVNRDPDIARTLPLAIADGREAVRLVRRRAAEWGIDRDRIGLMGFSAGWAASGATVALYSAWRAAARPAELHVYARGNHGFGMHKQGMPVDTWIERLGDWLQDQKFIRATSAK
jgi:acetyl esterase/lipase